MRTAAAQPTGSRRIRGQLRLPASENETHSGLTSSITSFVPRLSVLFIGGGQSPEYKQQETQNNSEPHPWRKSVKPTSKTQDPGVCDGKTGQTKIPCRDRLPASISRTRCDPDGSCIRHHGHRADYPLAAGFVAAVFRRTSGDLVGVLRLQFPTGPQARSCLSGLPCASSMTRCRCLTRRTNAFVRIRSFARSSSQSSSRTDVSLCIFCTCFQRTVTAVDRPPPTAQIIAHKIECSDTSKTPCKVRETTLSR